MSVYLVRHGSAGVRTDSPDDVGRPLDGRGRAQADVIAATLSVTPIMQILTSPALRCQQTVLPLARRIGLDFELRTELLDGAPPDPAMALLDDLLARHGDTVVCGHGDLLPRLIAVLRRRGVPGDERVDVAKGALWQVEVADGEPVRLRYSDPSSALSLSAS